MKRRDPENVAATTTNNQIDAIYRDAQYDIQRFAVISAANMPEVTPNAIELLSPTMTRMIGSTSFLLFL